MATGRPPKITKELGKKLAPKLARMFENGESLAEVCCELDMCKESFYKLCDISGSFSDAYKIGLLKSEKWWTELGRDGAAGKSDIQPATWMFNMKNRFKWRDRVENETTIKGDKDNPVSFEFVVHDAKKD